MTRTHFNKRSSKDKKQEAKSKPIPYVHFMSHMQITHFITGRRQVSAAACVSLAWGGGEGLKTSSSPYKKNKYTYTSCHHAPEPSARPRHKHQKEKMRKGALVATRRGHIPCGRVERVGGRVPNVSHNLCVYYIWVENSGRCELCLWFIAYVSLPI